MTEINSASSKRLQPIRFGIMCNGTTFPAWEADCIRKLLKLGYAEPALLIIDEDHLNNTNKWSRIKKLTRLWSLYSYFIVNRLSRALKPVDMSDSLANVPTVRCKVYKKGTFSQYFSEADIEKIKEYHLDFVLRFGFNIIRGKVLKAARYGVWSFHHDDEKKYRGAPPCFWEIYKNDNITGAMLQRLTDQLDGGAVLKKGFLKTIKTSYVENMDTVLFRSAIWPAHVCTEIQNGDAYYIDNPASTTSASVFYAPDNLQMIFFLLKVARNIVRRFYSVLFYDLWNIGIVDKPIQDFLVPGAKPPVKWLPAMPRTKFCADPFGSYHQENLHIFFEEFDYRTSKGYIAGRNLANWSISTSKEILHTPVHMSYPYLFEHEKELYCVPEASQSRKVSLYKVTEAPYKLIKICDLISDVAAIDSTILFYDNRWWLMATNGTIDKYDNLNIWYADDLLGDWKPHALNPVKIDISSARPAGTPFIHNGQLYRPSQDCSDHYGKQIIINRILRLTPTEFEEEKVALLEPFTNSQYPDGLHTISAVGNMTLIDGKKRAFIGINLTVLMHKIKEVLS